MTRWAVRAGTTISTLALLAAVNAAPALAHRSASHDRRGHARSAHVRSAHAHGAATTSTGTGSGSSSTSPLIGTTLAQIKALKEAKRQAKRVYNQTKRAMIDARINARESGAKVRVAARDQRRSQQMENRIARLQAALQTAIGRGDTLDAEQIERRLSLIRQRLEGLPGTESAATPTTAQPTTDAEYQALSERLLAELPTLAAAVTQAETSLAEARTELAQLEAQSGD